MSKNESTTPNMKEIYWPGMSPEIQPLLVPEDAQWMALDEDEWWWFYWDEPSKGFSHWVGAFFTNDTMPLNAFKSPLPSPVHGTPSSTT